PTKGLAMPRNPLLTVSLGACFAVLAAVWVHPDTRTPGRDSPDPWGLEAFDPGLQRERRRRAEIEGERDAVFQCREAKIAVVFRVAAGRVSLREAAARFRDINASRRNFPWDRFREAHPGATDDERHCREVIRWVRWWVEEEQGSGRSLSRRLEAELKEHL